ncbi:motility twitching protein PilT [Leadbettera azotonutricia]|uniref:PilT protein domain protein n=1 Tax=Leadbettera azotonutricia (strain ATCC BAA-888 / DSM 13862 / ZAS-9) TaxID=545695 RepID=F5Y922_LEAAZ|nr:motility twitching protein PilT [Leadbettera azotonutricia]AEF81824.1 PilT protein domain protein [Leadbettera azotonutricia ZAS-9]
MIPAYCLDACALITVVKKEPGFEIVRDLLRRATAREAAGLKSRHRMSHADALGLAAAKERGAAFVTSDHAELEPVEQHESNSFLWCGPSAFSEIAA